MAVFESGYVEEGYEWVEQVANQTLITFKYNVDAQDNAIVEFKYSYGSFEEKSTEFKYHVSEASAPEAICDFKYHVSNNFIDKIYDFNVNILNSFVESIIDLGYNVEVPIFQQSVLSVHYNIGNSIEITTTRITRLNEND